MSTIIKELHDKFLEIKNRGWIQGVRNGTSNIGDTFERLVGVPQNGFEIPDYKGIEIKTKRNTSKSYITLFSATPDGPHFHEVDRLKNKYGYPHSKHKEYKVLNNCVFVGYCKLIGLNYYFKLKIDRKNQKLFLLIFDKQGILIEDDVFWYFDTLKEKLCRKFSILAYINADTKNVNNIEYFKYTKITFYLLKDFDTFIYLMEKNIIRVEFKIGVYLSGKKKGQLYDHGTSFQIKEENLHRLFNPYNHL